MKAIAIVEMPNNCSECRLYAYEEGCVLGGWYDHGGWGRYDLSEDTSRRPSNCPLKYLPDKKQEKKYENQERIGYRKGWNACLKKITGETEMENY